MSPAHSSTPRLVTFALFAMLALGCRKDLAAVSQTATVQTSSSGVIAPALQTLASVCATLPSCVGLAGKLSRTFAPQPATPTVVSKLTPGPHLVATSYRVSASSSITVSWTGFSGSKTDWITIIGRGAPATSYSEWFYTGGKTSGSYTFHPVQPGTYVIRGFFDWPTGNYTVQVESSPITVY